MRNKNTGALSEIFKSNKLREVSGWEISHEEALALLDRDNIWRAFGLLDDDGYAQGDAAREILDAMRFGPRVPTGDDGPGVKFFRAETYPWPETLGGGRAKIR